MNVPFSLPSAESVGSLEQTYTNGNSENKGKTFPMQMYGNSPGNSPNSLSHNVETPSPPLTALSSRSVGNNVNLMSPSPLDIPQYSLQSPPLQQQQLQQLQQQTYHQQQQNNFNNQSQQLQQHCQNSQSSQSQQHLHHRRQQPQQNQQQQQQHQQHQILQNFAQFDQLQKPQSLQNFDFLDTGLDARHFQDNSLSNLGHPTVNGTRKNLQLGHDRVHQLSHVFANQDTLAQDPQLHLLHHHQTQHLQEQHRNQLQLKQQRRALSNGAVHDPRLQSEMLQNRRSIQPQNDTVIHTSQIHMHPQLVQTARTLSGGIQMLHPSLVQPSPSPSMGMDSNSKLVAATDGDRSKKKRGRPKKLILDPLTNQYIDSSHENFKRLNKLLKQNSDVTVKHSHLSMENGLRFDSLNDEEMKQLLDLKDRRGRPRKFPVEQTGITIKGVRVSGTMKAKRKEPSLSLDTPDKIKKRRGRPKRDTGTVV